MLDAVYGGGEGAFLNIYHALLNLVGAQTVVLPDDAHHRNVDHREDIRGGAKQHERAKQNQENRHYDKRIWAVEGQVDNPHNSGAGRRWLFGFWAEGARGVALGPV